MKPANPLVHLVLALLAGGLGGYGLSKVGPPETPANTPAPQVKPAPAPCPDCKPKRRPWAERGPAVAGFGAQGDPAVDLLAIPSPLRKANITSRGLGCCTFRSAEYAARWQNVPALYDFPEFLVANGIAGGGVPSKQAEMVRRIAASRNLPTPKFAQYEGNDLSFIELALKTGRVACVTWGGNHMLCCVHLDAEHACIVDNNAPDRGQWMTRSHFQRMHTMGGGGWTFVLLESPPAPPPINAARPKQLAAKDCLCSPLCTCGCNAGLPCRCPGSRRPTHPGEPELEGPPSGLDWVYGGVERYTVGERTVSRIEMEDALTDDSARPHLTVIGTPAERAAALAAIGPLAEAYHVQGYDPENWALGCGFSVGQGGPTTYFQAKDGSVLLRAVGTVGLAQKLRRADPNYRPEADPDGSVLSVPDGAKRALPYAGGGGGLLLLMYLLSRRKSEATLQPAPATQPQQPQSSPLDDLALRIGREFLTRQAETFGREQPPR